MPPHGPGHCVWKMFVEQLLRLRLLVSLNESLWGPQVLAARSFDHLSSWSSWSLQTQFSARRYLLVSTALNIFQRHTPNDPPGQQHDASTSLQFSSR
ncbi:hypothetical protein TNCV_5038731 [Trichonephila clavipes]|nr:hypothetical protein TNCV_5038731 [Trichonephila clavipes]